MNFLKKVLNPQFNRTTYWCFFVLALLLNLSEKVPWWSWIVNPLLLGWGAVGVKIFIERQLPVEFRYGLWRRAFLVVVALGVVLWIQR
jgi:hypothetical protein